VPRERSRLAISFGGRSGNRSEAPASGYRLGQDWRKQRNRHRSGSFETPCGMVEVGDRFRYSCGGWARSLDTYSASGSQNHGRPPDHKRWNTQVRIRERRNSPLHLRVLRFGTECGASIGYWGRSRSAQHSAYESLCHGCFRRSFRIVGGTVESSSEFILVCADSGGFTPQVRRHRCRQLHLGAGWKGRVRETTRHSYCRS